MTIRIKDWNKFQHYKSRKPPWIRLYRDLLDDLDFEKLDGVSTKILVKLWLIASEDENLKGGLPAIDVLAWRLRITEREMLKQINKLQHWLEFSEQDASIVQAERKQDATPETETDQRQIRDRSEVAGKPSAPQKKSKPKEPGLGTETWEAYSSAYKLRYDVGQRRTPKTSGQCANLVKRLGKEDAPKVARFYFEAGNDYYRQRFHPLDLLLKDCEAIKAEMINGAKIPVQKMSKYEKSQLNLQNWRVKNGLEQSKQHGDDRQITVDIKRELPRPDDNN